MSASEGSGDIETDSTLSQVNGTESFDWKKEQDKLVSKLGNFEKQLAQTGLKLSTLENDLKARTEERDDLRKQVTELQEQVVEAKKQTQKMQ
ncbi:hypothetical protein MML48_6g00000750 [Holotrichia oblita]|uniref:Uncharacterized protein n=1 Tax=Holotrichia oblita TaxID=644536 RepID=A0ACB9SZC6_HOLOL|nr:hypothetical protein MML48_6g00000750 [Holotrichia oblita]